MRKIVLLYVWLVQTGVYAQENLRVMFYNTENLFDCRHDSLKNDQDFLPEGKYHWSHTRYRNKLNNIAKVITAVGEWQIPALVGLCEVENDSVLIDLTHHSPLKNLSYRYVMTHSADARGIDLALLYQRDQFRLLGYNAYHVPLRYPTRDILHVTGQVINHDTLDIFVCHFPSRLGGEDQSNGHRIAAAKVLREKADSVISVRMHPSVVILGDFNDYPDNESLFKILGAKSPTEVSSIYANLMYPMLDDREHGSHKFQSDWGVLDQIIVNRALLQSSRISVKEGKAQIFRAPFLLEEDKTNGGERPLRTFLGFRYQGGFSDHLPVWMDLVVQ
ncbi:endonuclease/exonuclease/phosphatase family protein [Parabacteroides sp. FAFU027]|uniref:endonuclease/exonuclease/phosphatase family protein n=1 Tax=Parabacteroides sp. FAFU027 TaxID=2922715 RepID=UPI001FB03ECF|nr:endonuclease [Parabacteroides sp. FAFU027]